MSKLNKLLSPAQVKKTAEKHRSMKKRIVLIGGCFDILHAGHIKFLEKAKDQGDILFLLLESDQSVKKLKGEKRPINTQKDRAYVLSALSSIDYVVMLSKLPTDKDYDRLIAQIRPDVIALTHGDPNLKRRADQAKKVGAKVKNVSPRTEHSTEKLAHIIKR